MAEINSKSPEANYATRSEGVVANIKAPVQSQGAQSVAALNARAVAQLDDDTVAPDHVVTAINGTTIRANVDAAMVAQGATACNNAGARAAIAAVITDQLLLANTTQTVASSVSIDT